MTETPAKKTARRRKPSASKAASASPPASKQADSADVSPQLSTVFRWDIAVRWRDLDAFNHVNNSTFLTYLEEARLAWLEALPGPWLSETSAPVLAAATVNFRRPIGWPESLRIELIAERIGQSSLTLGHRIGSNRDPDALYSDGSVVMVWVDARTGKAASLPPAVHEAASAGGATSG